LSVLHEKKVLHRDIKSANVFLCKDGTGKIGDMNVSKINKRGLLYTQTGTPYYASPEVWNDKPYDSKSDIWSMGCVIYEMASLKPPFRAEDMEGLYTKVNQGEFKKLPSHFSVDLNNLIKSMLRVNPAQRPSADKLLTSPLIQKRLDSKLMVEPDELNETMLKTIKLPNNLHYLTDRLPGANYDPIKTKISA
jgi:NIMA (never in mitosis gene a)-related kinase 1/4/5